MSDTLLTSGEIPGNKDKLLQFYITMRGMERGEGGKSMETGRERKIEGEGGGEGKDGASQGTAGNSEENETGGGTTWCLALCSRDASEVTGLAGKGGP